MLEWIGQNKSDDKPFFAFLSYTAPHDPLHAPKKYIDKYRGKYDQGWDALREVRLNRLKELDIVSGDAQLSPRLPSVKVWDELSEKEREEAARDMEVYAAMIDYMDEQIARVFNYLKEIGEYDNTMIIFLSDNGANGHPPTTYPGQTEEYLNSFDNSLENRGLINSYIDTGPGWAQASMAPSRLFKAFTAEGGIRAPLIVKLPGAMPDAGTMDHSFLHVRDIMPTILDVAGIEFDQEINDRSVVPMQGSSLLDFLSGNATKPYIGSSQVGYELFGMKAFIDDHWKILLMPPPFGTGDWQLYDLGEDPGEIVDLSDQNPDRLVEMVAQWEQYQDENGVLDISHNLSGDE
jgi:arylsulfatase